jgi:ligand-binding SRPBCC domain-containing protein
MKIYQLETKLFLSADRDKVFKFFADPRNLERITPSWLRFEIITPSDSVIKQGTLLDYRLRLRGIPLRWQSEISVWEPPHRFVDRQTRDPYLVWVHEHSFAEHEGGTIVGDCVGYAVPGGRLVQKFFVAPELERIFDFGRRTLEQLFNSNTAAHAA